MRRTKIIVVLLLTFTFCYGQNSEIATKFMGGMFYGGSYSEFENNYKISSGFASCFGGRISYNVWPRIYLGGRGNSIKMEYESPSFYRAGSGGITAGYQLIDGVVLINLGIYAGGGRITNMHVMSTIGGLYITDVKSDSYIFVTPEIMLAYRLNRKIGITLIGNYGFFSKGNPGVKSRIDICAGVVFFR